MTAPVIEAVNVVKYYGKFRALDDVTFAVESGTVTGLLGPNGAGKSTLMKALLGLLPYSTGKCRVLGLSLADVPLKVLQEVGYMPEHEAWFPGLTGLESVVYAGRLTGMPREQAFSRAYEVLDYLGMDEVRHRPVTDYSVGLKQKIKLGQAVVHGPSLCFLDEPLSGLDPQSRDEMISLLKGIATSGVSLVISSHVLKDVETICDTILMLNKGQLLYSGSLEAMRSGSEGRYLVQVRGDRTRLEAHLGKNGAGLTDTRQGVVLDLGQQKSLQVLWQAARDCDCQVREVRPASVSLEQAFLRLLGREEA
jgi:ABC-2 type transport system ATP-binding protein